MTATATTMVKSIWQAYFKPAKAEAEEGEAAKVHAWVARWWIVWVAGGQQKGRGPGLGQGSRRTGHRASCWAPLVSNARLAFGFCCSLSFFPALLSSLPACL